MWFDLIQLVAAQLCPSFVKINLSACDIPVGRAQLGARQDQSISLFAFTQRRLERLHVTDIGAYGNVLIGAAFDIKEGGDGGCYPIQAAVTAPVAYLALPDMAIRDGVPHFLIELWRVFARLEEAMVVSCQFVTRVAADFAELVVDIGDVPRPIRYADDGVLVQYLVLLLAFIKVILQPGWKIIRDMALQF